MIEDVEKIKKSGAPLGNKNNRKYGDLVADSRLTIRIPREWKDLINCNIDDSINGYIVELIRSDLKRKKILSK